MIDILLYKFIELFSVFIWTCLSTRYNLLSNKKPTIGTTKTANILFVHPFRSVVVKLIHVTIITMSKIQFLYAIVIEINFVKP